MNNKKKIRILIAIYLSLAAALILLTTPLKAQSIKQKTSINMTIENK